MAARKLNKNNFDDLLKAYRFAAFGETIHLETGALNPNEYAGYTAAELIPGLNDSDPDSVLLFNIPSRELLAVVELGGYVPTNPGRNQGHWTTVRARLVREKKQPDKRSLQHLRAF